LIVIAGLLSALAAAPLSLDVSYAPELCNADRYSSSGFEDADARTRPSNGSGGQIGSYQFFVPGQSSTTAYVHASDSSAPLPLIIALHGAGGPGTQDAAASLLRNSFQAINTGAIIVAVRASGSQGGYVLGTDEVKIQTILSELLLRYNVDQNRIYGWGFSAGGRVMHEMALKTPSFTTTYTAHATILLAASQGGTAFPENTAYKKPLLVINANSDELIPLNAAITDAGRFFNNGWSDQITGTLGAFEFRFWNINHNYDTNVLRYSWNWMCPYLQVP
jgi:predicted peptidase